MLYSELRKEFQRPGFSVPTVPGRCLYTTLLPRKCQLFFADTEVYFPSSVNPAPRPSTERSRDVNSSAMAYSIETHWSL